MYDVLERDELRPGASLEAIAAAERATGATLPPDYRDFLAFSDGYNGEVSGHYLVLWSTGELPSHATGYEVFPAGPGRVLIGSNGGPTAFGVMDGRYISLPFVAAGPIADEIRVLGDSFATFLEAIARGEGW